ncbi:MAG TPA: hypothetical protein VHO69_00230, partial [Phototrophicaceae bacterium]|nr:hypothetical protein [Phototrophicaceae bacterium]
MKFRLLLLFMLSCAFCFSSAIAQDEFLPTALETITLDNVDRLEELVTVGDGSIDGMSLSPDGQYLAVVSRSTGIHIHDLNHPDAKPRTIAAEYVPIVNAIFKPDWEWVAISTPQTLSLIDVKTGEKVQELQAMKYGVHATTNDMVLNSDGRWLAATRGLDGGEITVWDTKTGEMLFTNYHRYMVGSPLFGPDDKVLVYAYYEVQMDNSPTPSFWYSIDTQTWPPFFEEEIRFGKFSLGGYYHAEEIQGPFVESIYTVQTSPDKSLLVSQTRAEETRVWDVNSSQELFRLPDTEHFQMFSPDNRLLIQDSATHKFWLLNAFTEEKQELASDGDYFRFAFSPDGKWLAAADLSATIHLINLEASQVEKSLTTGYLGYIGDLVFNPDGQTAYFTDNVVNLRQLDLNNGAIQLIVQEPDATGVMAYSPAHALIALATKSGVIEVWNIDNRTKHKTLTGHTERIRDLAFSSDGVTLASGSEDNTVRIWNVLSGESSVLAQYEDDVAALAFSPDGSELFVIDVSGRFSATTYDVTTGQAITTDEVDGYWSALIDYGVNNNRIAFSGHKITIRENVPDAANPQTNLEIELSDMACELKFNPEGDVLFTGSTDIYIQIYNTVSA